MTDSRVLPGGAGATVHLGRGILVSAADHLPETAANVLVVHTASVSERAHQVIDAVADSGRRVVSVSVPDAEAAKTSPVAAELWARLGQESFTRSDALIGVGGGAVTDLTGFVAATWLRGVEVIQVPTTLLAMVDAAVGGKTAINTGEGKNLVGAFHHARAVIADLDVLHTLPDADLRAGLAEVVKAGFIADEMILSLLRANPVVRVGDPSLSELVERAIRVKAAVVDADPRENLTREILNYGHTFGHAIERAENYHWRHGDAVAVGMCYAARLGQRAGVTPEPCADEQVALIHAMGLPTTYHAKSWPLMVEAMRRDKKARGASLRFVVLEAYGAPTRLTDPSAAMLRAAYDAVNV